MPDGQKTRGDMGDRRPRGGFDGLKDEEDLMDIPGSPEEGQEIEPDGESDKEE